MTTYHAVAWLDHHRARVLGFDADHVEADQVKAHTQHTRQHASRVRTEHEFFSDLCDALTGTPKVLLTGSHQALADFKHYVTKRRPALLKPIVAWEAVDHPTDGQLVALARAFFLKFDRMSGVPTPT